MRHQVVYKLPNSGDRRLGYVASHETVPPGWWVNVITPDGYKDTGFLVAYTGFKK
jgi:hypothetical protein